MSMSFIDYIYEQVKPESHQRGLWSQIDSENLEDTLTILEWYGRYIAATAPEDAEVLVHVRKAESALAGEV